MSYSRRRDIYNYTDQKKKEVEKLEGQIIDKKQIEVKIRECRQKLSKLMAQRDLLNSDDFVELKQVYQQSTSTVQKMQADYNKFEEQIDVRKKKESQISSIQQQLIRKKKQNSNKYDNLQKKKSKLQQQKQEQQSNYHQISTSILKHATDLQQQQLIQTKIKLKQKQNKNQLQNLKHSLKQLLKQHKYIGQQIQDKSIKVTTGKIQLTNYLLKKQNFSLKIINCDEIFDKYQKRECYFLQKQKQYKVQLQYCHIEEQTEQNIKCLLEKINKHNEAVLIEQKEAERSRELLEEEIIKINRIEILLKRELIAKQNQVDLICKKNKQIRNSLNQMCKTDAAIVLNIANQSFKPIQRQFYKKKNQQNRNSLCLSNKQNSYYHNIVHDKLKQQTLRRQNQRNTCNKIL